MSARLPGRARAFGPQIAGRAEHRPSHESLLEPLRSERAVSVTDLRVSSVLSSFPAAHGSPEAILTLASALPVTARMFPELVGCALEPSDSGASPPGYMQFVHPSVPPAGRTRSEHRRKGKGDHLPARCQRPAPGAHHTRVEYDTPRTATTTSQRIVVIARSGPG